MTLTSNDISILNAAGISWGACYSFNADGDVVCSHSLTSSCGGHYIEGTTCDVQSITAISKYNTNFWIPIGISAASLTGIQIGSLFQGGIYGGTYIPSGISFSDQISTISSSDNTIYALILYKDIIKTEYLKPTIALNSNTSNYNGRFNLVLENSIQPSLNFDNTFPDWYFPSISEIQFIKTQYKKYTVFRNKIRKMFSSGPKNITSSSAFSIPSPTPLQQASPFNKKYLYGINMEYDTEVLLINPYIESDFFCIRSIEVI